MKRFLAITIVALVCCSVIGVFTIKKVHLYSKTFEVGQCTWYAYERAKEAGWTINFDQPYGRHARNWPERVTNARLIDTPSPGEIMVLDAWPGNPYGHVAYVESVESPSSWTVTHANMACGQVVESISGRPIRSAKLSRVNNEVQFQGSSSQIKLIGFLVRS